eukprot:365422-Chlamydomonas_euryale.AAC.5
MADAESASMVTRYGTTHCMAQCRACRLKRGRRGGKVETARGGRRRHGCSSPQTSNGPLPHDRIQNAPAPPPAHTARPHLQPQLVVALQRCLHEQRQRRALRLKQPGAAQQHAQQHRQQHHAAPAARRGARGHTPVRRHGRQPQGWCRHLRRSLQHGSRDRRHRWRGRHRKRRRQPPPPPSRPVPAPVRAAVLARPGPHNWVPGGAARRALAVLPALGVPLSKLARLHNPFACPGPARLCRQHERLTAGARWQRRQVGRPRLGRRRSHL